MDFGFLRDQAIPWRATSLPEPLIINQSKKGSSDPNPVLVDPSQCLIDLKTLIPTRPDVAFFRTDNEFLERFLKARKYRVEEAFQVLCKYFTFRHQSRDLCIGLNASSPKVQAALIDGTVGVLPENDPCGRPILLILASNWNNSKYDVRTIYQTVLITLEHLVENPEVQRTGIIAIIDWSHFPARHATFLTPKTLRVFLEGLQDAFPMRLGALHMVSPPWYIEAALSLSKPFLKEKLRDRIFVHGNNLHTLHSNVPPRILPAELGGEGGEYNAQIWATKLIPPSKLQPSLRNEMKTSISHSGFSGSLDSAGPSKRDHNKNTEPQRNSLENGGTVLQ